MYRWFKSILSPPYPANGGRTAGYCEWCKIIHAGKLAEVSTATHLAVQAYG